MGEEGSEPRAERAIVRRLGRSSGSGRRWHDVTRSEKDDHAAWTCGIARRYGPDVPRGLSRPSMSHVEAGRHGSERTIATGLAETLCDANARFVCTPDGVEHVQVPVGATFRHST
jgi:hypothetical protein